MRGGYAWLPRFARAFLEQGEAQASRALDASAGGYRIVRRLYMPP